MAEIRSSPQGNASTNDFGPGRGNPGSGDQRRGRLRVFLGAAPGVGKTYTMLGEGRRLRAEGRDVVIGWVETHGRTETAAQIGDLEVIARRQITYRGAALEEMDTEAVIRRAPDTVLVDELAHTNPPGSARRKRYEDVAVLRAAGIDVISTINIQHLESLKDVVAGITGVTVRETIPDSVLADAEVQLADLPVDSLLDRLEQGKIYPPDRAQAALRRFFRAGNLTALRELALRQTAAGVDDLLERYMREHEIDDVWPAAERVLVVLEAKRDAARVLRHGWRLASALHGELVTVALVPADGVAALAAPKRGELSQALDLAEDLGSTTRIIATSEPVEQLAALIRAENPTVVVLAYQPRRGWRQLRPSLIDKLLARVDHVALQLVEVDES